MGRLLGGRPSAPPPLRPSPLRPSVTSVTSVTLVTLVTLVTSVTSGVTFGMARLLGSLALLMIAAFMMIGFLAGGGGDNPLAARIAAFVIAVGIPGAAGGLMLYRHTRGVRMVGGGTDQLRRQTHASEILKLAQSRGGKLTVVEVVADTSMSISDAEEALASLVERGLGDVEVTDSGLMVYVFRDVQQLGEKGRSRGLLDG